MLHLSLCYIIIHLAVSNFDGLIIQGRDRIIARIPYSRIVRRTSLI